MALAVTGTPTFFVNGFRLEGSPIWVFEIAPEAFRSGLLEARPLDPVGRTLAGPSASVGGATAQAASDLAVLGDVHAARSRTGLEDLPHLVRFDTPGPDVVVHLVVTTGARGNPVFLSRRLSRTRMFLVPYSVCSLCRS
jgi:hypothetical protein